MKWKENQASLGKEEEGVREKDIKQRLAGANISHLKFEAKLNLAT